MPQPFPVVQCWHQVPEGLASAGTAITLQQSVQVPQPPARITGFGDTASAGAPID
jgi:hypothetical protein